MLKLFSKEKALYLVDNPTAYGFSWWFFWAGVMAGYGMAHRFGDNYFVVVLFDKYFMLLVCGFLFIVRRVIEKYVKAGNIQRDSAMLYLVLPAGYAFALLGTMWIFHFIFALFIR